MKLLSNDIPPIKLSDGRFLFDQIADYYRDQIQSGFMPKGTRLPTCSEIARSLSLATQTVNRAFDLLAEEGLVYRRRSLGTIVGSSPNERAGEDARRPRRSSSTVPPISMIVRSMPEVVDQEDSIFNDYLAGLMEGFNAWKCRFEIAHLLPNQRDLELARELVESGQSRGFINLLIQPDATDYLIEKKVPMVMLNADETERGIASVVADHVRGYGAAWKYVEQLGHRKIAFFGSEKANNRRLREISAAAHLGEISLRVGACVPSVLGTETRKIWEDLVETCGAFGQGGWPTLFFTQNDLFAAQLIRTLQENGVRVPEDVSIIGFNDSPIAAQFHPTITTLAKPRFKMALAASQLLLDILAKRPGSQGRLQTFPVQLVVRETCQPLLQP